MSNILIATIAALLAILAGLAYLWLGRPRPSANYRAYQEMCRAAARKHGEKSGSRSGPDWR